MGPTTNSAAVSNVPSILRFDEHYKSTRRYTIPSYNVDLDPYKSPSTKEQIYAGPKSTKPNFLTTLPLGIIHSILDCMWPEEYSGLACTCRHALKLTNDQVEITGPNLSWQFFDEVYDDCFSRSISLAVACKLVRGWERQVEDHVNCTKCGILYDSDSEEEDEEDEEVDDDGEDDETDDDDDDEPLMVRLSRRAVDPLPMLADT